MYTRLVEDFIDDLSLAELLEESKKSLQEYYRSHYEGIVWPAQGIKQVVPSVTPNSLSGSPQKRSLTSRYKSVAVIRDELEEFFKLSPKDIDHCDPIQWRFVCQAQFPNLYCFAHDILAIPGVFVAKVVCSVCTLMFRLCCHCRASIFRGAQYYFAVQGQSQT